MPSIAVLVCRECGAVAQRPLTFGEKVPLMSPCDCGGRLHIARFVRERGKRSAPGRTEGRDAPAGA